MITGRYIVSLAVFLSCMMAVSQDMQSGNKFPDQIVIGRHTFVDFGPPTDFYEVFIVRSSGQGSSVERLTVTPAGQACMQPPTIERAVASLDQSIPALLHGKNPCSIPKKSLNRERKRCKKCMVFSGANIDMQVQCGSHMRTLRMDVLDRDMFDRSPHTPPNTSQTMALLDKLDRALGSAVMQRPIFSLSTVRSTDSHTETIEQLSDGQFDSLFIGAPDKPSTLYAESQITPPSPSISLISTSPISPTTSKLPTYPPIARLAHIEGKVIFKLAITDSGDISDVVMLSGPKMLEPSVASAVSAWKFPQTAAGKTVEAAIEFKLNCHSTNR